jgi:hypothetical protein
VGCFPRSSGPDILMRGRVSGPSRVRMSARGHRMTASGHGARYCSHSRVSMVLRNEVRPIRGG